jgi:hypothetical protein
MGPPEGPIPAAAAASLVPSADDATDFHELVARLFETQVLPEFVEV